MRIKYCKNCEKSGEHEETVEIFAGAKITYAKCLNCGHKVKTGSKPIYDYENK